ncbi:pMGF 360-2L [African swine fever virus]|uniref:Protein MGF 360-2L n=4 Tax=African swine fever virus TaxID=10497 RepID=3602L_ASFB7|nr:pKP362L [African swine fever virus]YP_009702246.1 pMGF 360-2L [African swine fever virus]YP_009702409.1 pKP362L [African swine fever virus]YP_009702570.1 pMGF 360-2L [African swine fever virus]YP_009703222.1 pMGF 360-2L [African swine fever virus]YP_009703454.1 MGF 360-2L [African swine fever virus Benin 97/1]YP_009703611.1 MGF 360-2L [African swine fever virus OURT 88/3]P23166.1 RecName: Full=Protein MGF 360-2L [African swine fever virus BA71V]AAA42682.1 K'362 [African swine fever virus
MSTPLSLQALAKKILATQHISKNHYFILKYCGLWWHGAPIMFSTNEDNQLMIKSAIFKDGLELNLALMKAVQENNYDLIELFTEWGADINSSLVTVNTEHTWNFCRELGAKILNEMDIVQIFYKIHRIKTSSNIILCHKLLSNNPLFQNIEELKIIICCFLEKISINFILNEITLNEMLARLWYSMAVRYHLTEAIQYFYQRYRHFKDWRLICGLSFNNVSDLHEIYHIKKVDMNIDEMMYLACMRDSNFLTIFYCFVLGANINRAMVTSVKNFYTNNLFFCIDLGANAFEESLELAKQKNHDILVEILSFKDFYNSNVSLLSLKTTDPEKINALLKNYRSKNIMRYKKLCPKIIRWARFII